MRQCQRIQRRTHSSFQDVLCLMGAFWGLGLFWHHRGCLNLSLEGLHHLVKEFILSLGLKKKKALIEWVIDLSPPSPLGPFFFFFPFVFISWRLITLQYCSGFCHTLTWISHGFTCVPLGPFRPQLHPALLAAMSRSNFWHINHRAWTWLVLGGWQTLCWTRARWIHSIISLTLPKMMWTWTINPWASPVTQPSSIPQKPFKSLAPLNMWLFVDV